MLYDYYSFYCNISILNWYYLGYMKMAVVVFNVHVVVVPRLLSTCELASLLHTYRQPAHPKT